MGSVSLVVAYNGSNSKGYAYVGGVKSAELPPTSGHIGNAAYYEVPAGKRAIIRSIGQISFYISAGSAPEPLIYTASSNASSYAQTAVVAPPGAWIATGAGMAPWTGFLEYDE